MLCRWLQSAAICCKAFALRNEQDQLVWGSALLMLKFEEDISDSRIASDFAAQIMKSDEDVRMISAEAPVLFARVRRWTRDAHSARFEIRGTALCRDG